MLRFDFGQISIEVAGGQVKVSDSKGLVQANVAVPPEVRQRTSNFVDGIIAALEELKKNIEE